MYRVAYRVGLFLGAAILSLFIGARLINIWDPYRILTEDLIAEVAAEPERTVRLNEYDTLAAQLRTSLFTEQAAKLDDGFKNPVVSTVLDLFSFRADVGIAVAGLETAVTEIAELDNTLVAVDQADALSRNLARLRFYDLEQGDVLLADLYAQSTAVSHSLTDVSNGLDKTATAVAAVTNTLDLPKLQQSLAKVSNGDSSLVSQSLQSWMGLPDNLWAIQQKIVGDVVWLDDFEQQYVQAKAVNDQWRFDTLRLLPGFVGATYKPLLLGVIGSLLLALAGWLGSRKPQRSSAVHETQPNRSVQPVLAFYWADGRTDHQFLPRVGELTIGNIVIRRARVRYYLERIDNAFPVFLNGQAIGQARTLNDGDVLQIDELQAVFQLAA